MKTISEKGGKALVTISELAEAAGCTVPGVHKAIRSKNIVGWQRLGLIYVIPIREANKWIQNRKGRLWHVKSTKKHRKTSR